MRRNERDAFVGGNDKRLREFSGASSEVVKRPLGPIDQVREQRSDLVAVTIFALSELGGEGSHRAPVRGESFGRGGEGG